jgi:hypothetical protein
MSLEIWASSAASRIFNAFSLHAKLLHSIADIRIGECLVPMMFNQLRMNLRQLMALFPEIADEASQLHGSGKRVEDLEQLLLSSYFISYEDWPVDFHLALATTRELYASMRLEMEIASEMPTLQLIVHPVLCQEFVELAIDRRFCAKIKRI